MPPNTAPERSCAGCSKRGTNLLACARCKQVWYCSRNCQMGHFPNHKVKCRQLAPGSSSKASRARVKIPEIATVDSAGQHTHAEGIEVVETKDLGKACIATRDFSVGDTVLLEPPAVVFDERDGYAGLFNAFLNASSETQQKILQMYRPSEAKIKEHLDEKRKKIRIQRQQLLVHQYNQYIQNDPAKKEILPLALAELLIGVVDANAHAFQSEHTVDIVATSTNNAVPKTYHALFTLGSRVEHSCSPNLTFITQGGKLEYVAELNIKSGDRLAISYMGSVYERPRKQRRGFLKENKMFFCKCLRCMSWDECSPIRCDCQDGIMFHSGERDQWECQACDKKATQDDHVNQQLRGEAEVFARIRKFQYILQTDPYPEMLQEILEVVKSSHWAQFVHPLHWLNVEAYKLISSVAASAARYYAKENKILPTSKKISTLLRLSSMSMLRRILWSERVAAIDRGLVPLKDGAKVQENFDAFSHKSVRVEDVSAVLNELCDNQILHDFGTLGVSPAFHAGQDLILAQHKDLAYKLYKRFEVSFQRWRGLSEQSRDKIKVFLDSGGKDSQFGNFLLL